MFDIFVFYFFRIFDSRSLQVTHTFQRKQHIQTWCDISNDNQYCVTSSNGFDGNGCEATVRKESVLLEHDISWLHFEMYCKLKRN